MIINAGFSLGNMFIKFLKDVTINSAKIKYNKNILFKIINCVSNVT